jgi:SAM-dependent methyltransferase
LTEVPKDFTSITELPGRRIGREGLAIIGRRYLFAARFAPGKRVLEIGCGPGLGLGYLSQVAASVVAGDVTSFTLAKAKATYGVRPQIRFVQFDGEKLPFQDAAFDLVVAMAMINYLDAGVFLDECRRVLAPCGSVAFCTPNRECSGFRPGRLSTRYYSVCELHTLASRHGFAVEVFGGFPAPHGGGRVAQRAIALGGTVLAALPFGPGIRNRARDAVSRLIGYDTVYLDGELTHAHVAIAEAVPLVPLQADRPDCEHRILYAIARTVPRRA